MDIRDEIELERLGKRADSDKKHRPASDSLANLQRCREEREKVITEQAVNKPTSAQATHSSKCLPMTSESRNIRLI